MFRIIVQDAKNVTITNENGKFHGNNDQKIHFEEFKYFEIRSPINNTVKSFPEKNNDVKKRDIYVPENVHYKRKNQVKKYHVSLDRELPFPRKRKNIRDEKLFNKLNEDLDNMNEKHKTRVGVSTLLVENFPKDVKIKEIRHLFGKFGSIVNINFRCGYLGKELRATTKSVCIEFEDVRDAEDALKELNGGTFGGRIMKIKFFLDDSPKKELRPLNFHVNQKHVFSSSESVSRSSSPRRY